MIEPRPLLGYVVGDEITASMELWHRMNLLSVEVVFVHREDPSMTLTLDGVPEFVGYGPSSERHDEESLPSEPCKISKVLLSGEVGLGHMPGEYAVSHAEFYTASGQEIRHDIRADKPIPSRISVEDHAFRVVQEPNSIDWANLRLVDDRLKAEPPSEG